MGKDKIEDWSEKEIRKLVEKIIANVMDNIKRIYRESKSKVKMGKNYTESFWRKKGVRQDCPLKPLQFILFIADIKIYPRKRQVKRNYNWGR